MTPASSIFHNLQKEGAKSLRLTDLRPGFEVNLSGFVKKVANFLESPFPVFAPDAQTVVRINSRFKQINAVEGLSPNVDLSDVELDLRTNLMFEELLSTPLPAQRFGFEIYDDNNHGALLIEAVKEAEIAFKNDTKEVPYSALECKGKRLSDCNFLHIYYLSKDEKGDSKNYIYLESQSFIFSSSDNLGFYAPSDYSECRPPRIRTIPGTCFSLTKIPKEFSASSHIGMKEVLSQPTPETLQRLMEGFNPLFEGVLNFLWTLKRDPKFVAAEFKDFPGENKLRKTPGLGRYSPLQLVSISEGELRRVEFKRASEIANAISNTGGYKIPGLVLVGEHIKKKSGTKIEAYARCANEVVREKATKYLRESDYDQLAILVRDFGHRSTQELFGLSRIVVPRLIK